MPLRSLSQQIDEKMGNRMKVRITTEHGEFEAELDEGMTVNDLFPTGQLTKDGEFSSTLVSFIVPEDIRVTMLKSLIRIVEEDL